ncbi:MAG: T9SS type A sorting domain-containing protein [Candidatus Cloacimonetes bacterium]|nr:T9SS type A sorting domain-containing protein [Candidatus Cloacimonadota bacterium]
MKKPKFFFLLIVLFVLFLPTLLLANVNFRVLTYNVLNFSETTGIDRIQYFQTVLDAINPDIIIMQEMINEEGAELMLDSLNSNGQEYAGAEFINGYDTDNMFYYRTSIVTFISQDTIHTALRDISEYVVNIGGDEIRFYSCHLKAGQGSTNRNKRLAEVTILRNRLNNLPEGTEFIIIGDMNFYYSNEPGYQKFIADEDNNIGRAEDLIGEVGYWHDNKDYAQVHTQSTRTTQFGGGASGGLDDRFDFILVSYGINDSARIDYVDSSYKAFGNDCNHLNMSINDSVNGVVSQNVANALYYASDHLPVYADFISLSDPYCTDEDTGTFLNGIKLHQNYPNPVYNSTVIQYKIKDNMNQNATIKIFNLRGELIRTVEGNHGKAELDVSDFSTGIYFYQFKNENFNKIKKMIVIHLD